MLKTIPVFILFTSLLMATPAQAEGWLDNVKAFFGLTDKQSQQQGEENKQSVTNLDGLMTSLKSLGVTDDQVKGGLAAIFNFIKNQVSQGDFKQLTDALPGSEALLTSVPDISELKSSSGLSGLLEKASEYSESAKAVNDLNKQFEALELSSDMIVQYGNKIKDYLNTPAGAEAKKVLEHSFGKFLG